MAGPGATEGSPVKSRRLIGAIVVGAAVAFSASGCNFLTPVATNISYDPADGISGATGEVDIRNALIVANPEEPLGNVAVTFVNNGDPTTLQIRVGEESQTIDLDSGATTFGYPEQQLVFDLPTLDFWAHQNVSFQADGSDPVGLPLQLFSTEAAHYEDLGPTPASADGVDEAAAEADAASTETPEPSETTAP